MQTGQDVAIKIVKKKKNFTTQAQLEISILESLQSAEHAGRKYIGACTTCTVEAVAAEHADGRTD